MSNKRKILVLNQASNYLTVGFCNSFVDKVNEVVLVTGGVHVQGESLKAEVGIHYINRWQESHGVKKAFSYLLAMFQMWWLCLTRFRNHEVFFVSVPPMAYLLNLVLPNKFSMVIWDVYPDVFKITGMKEDHLIYRFWSLLNKWSFQRAFKIFTISEKMAELVSQYVDEKKIIIQPIWSIFQQNEKVLKANNPFILKHSLENKFVVQYSGNIGLTHNVEVLIDLAFILKKNTNIVFQIIGRGPRKKHLENLVGQRNLPNCVFLPFQSDEMFPYSLSAADIGVVILDETTSKGSVPSKSYNLMSYGIPSLYIASNDSQLKVYTNQYEHGACFEKSELLSAAGFIENLLNNKEVYSTMARKAEIASLDFRRTNADVFIDKYLKNEARHN